MIERSLNCLGPQGFHRLAYAEWPGPRLARTLICVHGLTRNGRDFDRLAEALSAHFRVICPDMPGRGKSDWLPPAEEYGYALYLADVTALIARLDVTEIDWLGTSMGGVIGMLLAALPGAPIRRLVVNDIGAVIAKEGLERISRYVGRDPSYADLDALEASLRRVAAPFGPLTDEQWRHLASHSMRVKADGSIGFACDPRIGEELRNGPPADVELWPQWDAICCPALILRGAESDILRRADAEAMTRRGPPARLVEFAGIGHAPMLMEADQIAAIRDFLLG